MTKEKDNQQEDQNDQIIGVLFKSLFDHPSSSKATGISNNAKILFDLQYNHNAKIYEAMHEAFREYQEEYGYYPKTNELTKIIRQAGEFEVADVCETLEGKEFASIGDDTDFNLSMNSVIAFLVKNRVGECLNNAAPTMNASETKVGLTDELDTIVSTLSSIRETMSNAQETTFSLVYGKEVLSAERLYLKTKQDKEELGKLPYTEFFIDTMPEVRTKAGDLLTYAGFTSNGKSVLLRAHAYNSLLKGKNVVFFTLEMSYEITRLMFAVSHANNKTIFPKTPIIHFQSVLDATLTAKEEEFLFKVADQDLRTNENYGSLLLEQSSQADWGLTDLSARVKDIDRNIFPVDEVVLDYITLLSTHNTGKRFSTERAAMNQLIKDAKQFALTFKDIDGNPKPITFISAAQISRDGYNRAIAKENYYDLTALAEYSELEKSSDVVLTVLSTPEMRGGNTALLQCLKNRNGAVPVDATQIMCGFSTGYEVSGLQNNLQSEEDRIEALRQLDI